MDKTKKLLPEQMLQASKRKEALYCVKLKESSCRYGSKYHRRKEEPVIRVESAETQDHVSGQQGFEDFKKKLRSSVLSRARSVNRNRPYTCATINAEKKASRFSNLRLL